MDISGISKGLQEARAIQADNSLNNGLTSTTTQNTTPVGQAPSAVPQTDGSVAGKSAPPSPMNLMGGK